MSPHQYRLKRHVSKHLWRPFCWTGQLSSSREFRLEQNADAAAAWDLPGTRFGPAGSGARSFRVLSGSTWVVLIGLKRWTPRWRDRRVFGQTVVGRSGVCSWILWKDGHIRTGESCHDARVQHWWSCREGAELCAVFSFKSDFCWMSF